MPASSMTWRVEPGDLLGDEDALLEAAVRELQAGDDVADGVHAGDVGAQPLVGEHEAAVHRDAGLLVAEAGGRGPAADGDEQQVGLDRLAALEASRVTPVVGLGRRPANRTPVLNVDAALAERALERLAEQASSSFGTSGAAPRRSSPRRRSERHTLANSTPMTPPPSTIDALRHAVELERLLAGDDPSADLEAGQRPGVGAGGEHDVLAASYRLAADLDGVRPRRAVPSPSTTVIAAALDQALQALVQPADDAVAVGVHAGQVDALERGADAELLATPRVWSATSAACRSALVGMQPRCRQVPPSLSFSMRATVSPSSAPRSAAA